MSKFKPGDKVQYVNGRNPRNCGIIIGPNPNFSDTSVVLNEGVFCNVGNSYLELMPEPRKVSGWVNVNEGSEDDCRYVHNTRERADQTAKCYPHLKRIACIYVSGTEGVEP